MKAKTIVFRAAKFFLFVIFRDICKSHAAHKKTEGETKHERDPTGIEEIHNKLSASAFSAYRYHTDYQYAIKWCMLDCLKCFKKKY